MAHRTKENCIFDFQIKILPSASDKAAFRRMTIDNAEFFRNERGKDAKDAGTGWIDGLSKLQEMCCS